MPSKDETVVHEDVLELMQQIRARGWQSALTELENKEPVLAAFTLASLYTVHRRLDGLWMPQRALLVIENELMIAQLVGIEAMRQASRNLWRDFLPDPGDPEAK